MVKKGKGKMKFGGLLAVLAMLLLSSHLPAQALQQFKVNNIRIEGNETADSSVIMLNSGLIRGSYITADHVQRAIRNLWQLNLFSDIQVLAERQAADGLDLLIQVKEFPKLESYTVTGNKKLKKKDVDKEISFYNGMMYTPFKQYKAKRALMRKYRDEGYLLAEVDIKTEPAAEGNRLIASVDIREGKKVQVKRIQVLGSNILKPKELKKAFKEVKEKRWWRGRILIATNMRSISRT